MAARGSRTSSRDAVLGPVGVAPREAASRDPRAPPDPARVAGANLPHERPARQLHAAAAIIGTSVLFDSAIEHYRGSFKNAAMVLPLVSSALTIAASLHGTTENRPGSHPARTLVYLGAIGVGALGTGFHAYNVAARVGGFRWENLFYGAPLGAPAALGLAGLAGLAADRLAGNAQAGGEATLFGQPAGPVVGACTAVGLAGTVAEVGLLHFRGSFQNPAMYLPVVIPPVAAAAMAVATVRPTNGTHRLARVVLGATSVLGIAGVAFHCYGVARSMGGWRNWRQNLLDGPPVPAPPSFSGLAVAGLAALKLIERRGRR